MAADTTYDDLETPLRRRLGPKTARVLESLDLYTVGDLLYHLPRRLERRGQLTPLAQLKKGEHATINVEVVEVRRSQMRDRRGTRVVITGTDGADVIQITFFSAKGPQSRLARGDTALFSGQIGSYKGQRQLVHPALHAVDTDDDIDAEEWAAQLIPVYPSSAVAPSPVVARSIQVVLDVIGIPADPVPTTVRAALRMPSRIDALLAVHRPTDEGRFWQARRRLLWEEAFVLQVELVRRRAAVRARPAVPRPARAGGVLSAFDDAMPFALTAGQRKVGAEIAADLAASHPMHRLLQGEVGSGKTVVALRAMLSVVDAGGQAVLLAPTEVLAQQHFRSIQTMLGPLARAGELDAAHLAASTRVVLLTGSVTGSARKEALEQVRADPAVGIVVGTHALLQESVRLRDLGLVVVDEQHRFGVEQRDALRERAAIDPHLLVMTATPIPRTVAMTIFGDLDRSTLRDAPLDRAGFDTYAVPVDNARYVERAWQRVVDDVRAGRQAFVVCPLIRAAEPEAGEDAPAVDDGDDRRPTGKVGTIPLAVEDVLPMLEHGPLAGLRLAAMHGQLSSDQKAKVMDAFAAGAIDVLVCTTVIEVGVDVPNATAMVVLAPERFGLSQLHQLRGRVGRGTHRGVCLLVTGAATGSTAHERVQALVESADGFDLAEKDLVLRQEGDVLGRSQSGWRTSLKNLKVIRDRKIIAEAREHAVELVERDPELARHPTLRAELEALVATSRPDFLERG